MKNNPTKVVQNCTLTPNVAIILASYNGEYYIREQLMSIVRQEGVKLHIFIRDDVSTDQTNKVINEVKEMTELVTLLPSFKSTGSAAGNFLLMLSILDLSGFTHIALSDQDDIWAAGKIARAVKLMEKECADGYSSDLISYSVSTQRVKYIVKSERQKPYDYLFQGGSAGCTYVLTSNLYEYIKKKINQVPTEYFKNCSHDWLIYAAARSADFKWVIDKEAHIFYRQHKGNIYGARTNIKGLFAKLGQLRSGWYRENIYLLHYFIKNNKYESKILTSIKNWKFKDRIYIAVNAGKFRRSKKDVLVLAICALVGLM